MNIKNFCIDFIIMRIKIQYDEPIEGNSEAYFKRIVIICAIIKQISLIIWEMKSGVNLIIP